MRLFHGLDGAKLRSLRKVLLVCLVAGGVLGAGLCVRGVASDRDPPPPSLAFRDSRLPDPATAARLPPGVTSRWWSEAQREIEAGQGGFAPRPAGDVHGWQLRHTGAGLVAGFDANGYTLEPLRKGEDGEGAWTFRLTLKAMGREGRMRPVADVAPEASGGRVRFKRGMVGASAVGAAAVEEWYRNVHGGIEQGFDIAARPEGDGPLVLLQALETTLDPGKAGPWGLTLSRGGAEVFSYRDLKAWDAGGRELKAWMAHGPGELRLVVEDAAAAYPIRIDPLASSPDRILDSDQAYASLGTSVASAGDVNGDGYSDVVVTAGQYGNGQAGEGRVFVYHGSSTGVPATADWSAESDQTQANMTAAASAGDVNGDGYADVIVGSARYDNGETNEGRVYVFHGSSTGLSATANWTAEADLSTSNFGSSVASAGDVDGDGYADVIVGAYEYTNGQTNEGRAYVYHGSAMGLSAAAVWTAEPNQSTAQFGISVASAGDVDGDGYDDVVVGAYLYDNGHTNEGRVFVFHGSSTGLSAAAVWTAEPNQSTAGFGRGVASVGDVNGDGYSDVILGASTYSNGEAFEGRDYVYHGSSTGLLSTAAWMFESDQLDAAMGAASGVASAGDVNGDGFGDAVVAASAYDSSGEETEDGRFYVFHSTDTTTYNTYNLPGKRRILNPGAGDLLDPSVSRVARDSNGYWYLAWSAGRATDVLLSYTTTSTPTLATDWATITLVDEGGTGVIAAAPANNANGAVPAIALSADDKLHLAWQKVSTADYYWTSCTSLTAIDDSASWGTPISVHSGATASEALRGLDLAVDRSGTAHLAYTSGTVLVYSKYRSDSGSFYKGAALATGAALKPRLAIDLDQNVYVIWHDNASPYDISLLCTTNAFSVTPAASVWKNLGQTTTTPDTVNNTATELPAGGSAALVVDLNGICHVAWRTAAGESPSAALMAREGMINLGWETGPATLDATVHWKTPVSLTAMGNGDVQLFGVAGAVVAGGAKRDAVCTITYTAPTTYRAYGSWDLSGDPVYAVTSDIRAGGSQGLWTERLAPRNRTDALWFVANDAQHAISTSYTDRKTGSAGWRPPAMSSGGFHPHYVYAFPNTDVDLGSMPLPVVSQTALKGAVYMADASATGHVYAIDRATGIMARSYTLGGTAEFITSASYAGNVHLFVHQASNQLLKLTDTGSTLTFDTTWSNNPLAVSSGSIRVPPIFMVEGGTRYLYLTTIEDLSIAFSLDKLYADNGNRVAGFPAGTLYAPNYTEQTLRALNDQVFIAGRTNRIYRRDADGTGEISSSVIANTTKHVFLVRDGNNLFVAPEDNWVWRLTSGLATSTWTSGKSADLGATKHSAAYYTSGTGSIYVGRGNVLYRLNATDGSQISSWTQPAAGNIVTPPVLWSTYVYFGTDTGELFAVHNTTNVARANWPITLDSTNGVPVVRTIAFDGSFGHVYFTTNEGRVYKFSLE